MVRGRVPIHNDEVERFDDDVNKARQRFGIAGMMARWCRHFEASQGDKGGPCHRVKRGQNGVLNNKGEIR